MKYFLTLFFGLALNLACRQKTLSGAQLENKLMTTMQEYLNKTAKPGVTYAVKDVTFFPDEIKKEYNCEFKVNMRVGKIDTTGIMTADIPNDFSTVERKQ
jgi:hypothetical protein